jgi:hypothetical protein
MTSRWRPGSRRRAVTQRAVQARVVAGGRSGVVASQRNFAAAAPPPGHVHVERGPHDPGARRGVLAHFRPRHPGPGEGLRDQVLGQLLIADADQHNPLAVSAGSPPGWDWLAVCVNVHGPLIVFSRPDQIQQGRPNTPPGSRRRRPLPDPRRLRRQRRSQQPRQRQQLAVPDNREIATRVRRLRHAQALPAAADACHLYVRGLAGVSRTRRDSAGPGGTKEHGPARRENSQLTGRLRSH